MKIKNCIVFLTFGTTLAGLIILAACAVQKNTSFGAAEIVSHPPGADVMDVINNNTLGTTPFTYIRKTDYGNAENIVIKTRKPGYEEETTSFFLDPGYEDEKTAMKNPQQVEIFLQPIRNAKH
ncbi:MAG: hypothetical protein SCH71_09065 [Desulfobulbaceae bacterium]|nr:hypothetical protein [Desulfobulbaceae bacterium]